MDSVISLAGRDFVLSVADVTAARSIAVMKDTHDKVVELDRHRTLSVAGEIGDAIHFTEYIQRNVHLYELRSGTPLSTRQIAYFLRGELARFLRQHPYQVNLILGGYDADGGPSLYYVDYLGSLHRMPFTAQGYCAYFILSTLDRLYRPGMTLDEAVPVMRQCLAEVGERFLLQQRKFVWKVTDRDGTRTLPQSADTFM